MTIRHRGLCPDCGHHIHIPDDCRRSDMTPFIGIAITLIIWAICIVALQPERIAHR